MTIKFEILFQVQLFTLLFQFNGSRNVSERRHFNQIEWESVALMCAMMQLVIVPYFLFLTS